MVRVRGRRCPVPAPSFSPAPSGPTTARLRPVTLFRFSRSFRSRRTPRLNTTTSGCWPTPSAETVASPASTQRTYSAWRPPGTYPMFIQPFSPLLAGCRTTTPCYASTLTSRLMDSTCPGTPSSNSRRTPSSRSRRSTRTSPVRLLRYQHQIYTM